jgi:hypothetical protein
VRRQTPLVLALRPTSVRPAATRWKARFAPSRYASVSPCTGSSTSDRSGGGRSGASRSGASTPGSELRRMDRRWRATSTIFPVMDSTPASGASASQSRATRHLSTVSNFVGDKSHTPLPTVLPCGCDAYPLRPSATLQSRKRRHRSVPRSPVLTSVGAGLRPARADVDQGPETMGGACPAIPSQMTTVLESGGEPSAGNARPGQHPHGIRS